MKNSRQSKIIIHGRGAGELGDDDVEKRAREIAVIRGRSADEVSEEDRAESWAELRGDRERDTIDTDSESRGSLSRDPSEPVGDPGHRVTNPDEESDDTTDVERLTNEGLEEAEHDQMLAAREDERRRQRRE